VGCRGAAVKCSALLAVMLLSTCPLAAQSVGPPSSCKVTRQPEPKFVPPAPYPPELGPGRFYFGTPQFWTAPFEDWTRFGMWSAEGYRVKFAWFANDVERSAGAVPGLTVEGRRIDGASAAMRFEGGVFTWLPEYPFAPSILIFPAAGCWEITATRRGSTLKFTAWIQ
jgi:hypothetical protein